MSDIQISATELFFGVIKDINMRPYFVRTHFLSSNEVRERLQSYGPQYSYLKHADVGGCFGVVVGLILLAAQIYFYSQNPNFLFIPLVTNIYDFSFPYLRK